MPMSVPNWVEDAIFYQIFPDRFANGEKSNDPPNITAWDTLPTSQSFYGGDLRGIIQKIDYLLDLGINAIYVNPIFQSTSTHRYNTTDYLKIDDKLGDLRDFLALLDVAHSNGVRVILDGVFNHCGRGFFAFNDLLENQEQSAYKDWFHINRFPVDAYTPGDAKDYVGWWKLKSLPKFNTANLQVRKYLFYVAKYWIEKGADGWRLDVPNEIDDDTFWAEFREVVKSTNPEAYLLGEIWNAEPLWVSEGHFDGLMNYPLKEIILKFANGSLKPTEMADGLGKLAATYPHENTFAMYNHLGTHDTQRLFTELGGVIKKIQLAMMLQFAFPGSPAIYYGDEIGLEGGKDPDSRRPFPWNQEVWNRDIYSWVKRLIQLRKGNLVLRRGNFLRILADDSKNCFAFSRTLADECILVIVNNGKTNQKIRLAIHGCGLRDGMTLNNLLGSEEFIVSGGTVEVSILPESGMWLKHGSG
jgi:cyclomaltodextrinase